MIITFRAQVTPPWPAPSRRRSSKLHGTTTDVSGAGDAAYSYTATAAGGHTVNTLVTLVGETQVTVTSTASVTPAETLAQQIFATLSAQATTTTSRRPRTTAAP